MSKTLLSLQNIAPIICRAALSLSFLFVTFFTFNAAAATPSATDSKESPPKTEIVEPENPSIGAWQIAAEILGIPTWVSIDRLGVDTDPLSVVSKSLRSFYDRASANIEVVNQQKDRSCNLEKLNTTKLNHD